jgi:hypothetical protein
MLICLLMEVFTVSAYRRRLYGNFIYKNKKIKGEIRSESDYPLQMTKAKN